VTSFRTERFGEPTPYLWNGMRVRDWFGLLASGNFDISLNCLPRILATTLATPLNSALGLVAELLHGRRIDAVVITPPVFVIGHWRSGTTFLHELLAEDPALGAPTVYQCFFPSAFMVAPGLGPFVDRFLTPTRPFDNMVFAHDRPQEDEFALANLGIGSPYSSLAFPRHGPRLTYLDLVDLPEHELRRWETAYIRLLKRLELTHGKRLVLKSPLHTARVGTLSRLFPGARFIHVSRNPFDVFPSTVHTFRVMGSWQGLHNPGPDDEALKAMTYEMFERMFAAYDRDSPHVPAGHLAEVRYEDLVRDPEATLRDIYRTLGLDGFANALPRMRAYLESRKAYQRNVFAISDDDRSEIVRRWQPYFRRFGYAEAG
jgi:omega-hydroxy-beta-dihydromenaquinone-9 sulfotransferase